VLLIRMRTALLGAKIRALRMAEIDRPAPAAAARQTALT